VVEGAGKLSKGNKGIFLNREMWADDKRVERKEKPFFEQRWRRLTIFKKRFLH